MTAEDLGMICDSFSEVASGDLSGFFEVQLVKV